MTMAMLAHEYEKHSKKMVYPALVQPKLDGIRCIAKKEHNQVNLFFRSGDPILSVPHINAALLQFMSNGDHLDGELYRHDVSFDQLSGDIRSQDGRNTQYIQYHIYDHPVVLEDAKYNQMERTQQLMNYDYVEPLHYVQSFMVEDEDHMLRGLKYFMDQGYEGIMIRHVEGAYKSGKRSHHLLKLKKFYEAEYEIIGALEGKGKLAGKLGKWECVTADGEKFKVAMDTTHDELERMWTERSNYIGKQLTVKYQELTKRGAPRFGRGKGIRFDL